MILEQVSRTLMHFQPLRAMKYARWGLAAAERTKCPTASPATY